MTHSSRVHLAPAHHAGSPRPSPVSHACHRDGHVARPSVVRLGIPPMSAFAHEQMLARFQPAEPRSSGLPIDRRLYYAVRHRLHLDLPPSPHGHFMVELFTAGRFDRSPGVVITRSPASLRTSSPRRHGLSEVSDLKPPVTDYAALWPDGPNAASPIQA